MVSDDLMKESVDKDLKCDSLSHVATENKVITLADWRDVFFLYGWSDGQVIYKHLIDPQEVLAFAVVTIVG